MCLTMCLFVVKFSQRPENWPHPRLRHLLSRNDLLIFSEVVVVVAAARYCNFYSDGYIYF